MMKLLIRTMYTCIYVIYIYIIVIILTFFVQPLCTIIYFNATLPLFYIIFGVSRQNIPSIQ